MSDVLYRKCAPILSTAKSKNSHFAIDELIKRVEKDKLAFQLVFLIVFLIAYKQEIIFYSIIRRINMKNSFYVKKMF